jgi:hypothetical protein
MIIVSNIKAVNKAIISIDMDRSVYGTTKMIVKEYSSASN